MIEIKESVLIIWSTPIYIGLIALEIVLTHGHVVPSYTMKNTIENILLCLFNSAIDLMIRGVALVALLWAYQFNVFQPGYGVWYWISLVIVIDFQFYLLHYVDHRCRLFWAIHVTHHSSEEFNLTVGFRSSVFQPLYRFIYFLPIAVLGFAPVDILLVYSASQIYGILLHTKLIGKLGWLELILATPSHHRVHHGCNPAYIDKNMGMLLIIWDRLFGTFQEENEPVKFGITKPIPDRSIKKLVFSEWSYLFVDLKNTKSAREFFKVLLGPP